MGRVFIPQETQRRVDGNMVSAFDFSPAMRYGDLTVILPPGPPLVSMDSVMRPLRAKLHDFSDDDYIVATGDPALIAVVSMMAAAYNSGRVKLLRWDRHMQGYQALELNMPFN